MKPGNLKIERLRLTLPHYLAGMAPDIARQVADELAGLSPFPQRRINGVSIPAVIISRETAQRDVAKRIAVAIKGALRR